MLRRPTLPSPVHLPSVTTSMERAQPFVSVHPHPLSVTPFLLIRITGPDSNEMARGAGPEYEAASRISLSLEPAHRAAYRPSTLPHGICHGHPGGAERPCPFESVATITPPGRVVTIQKVTPTHSSMARCISRTRPSAPLAPSPGPKHRVTPTALSYHPVLQRNTRRVTLSTPKAGDILRRVASFEAVAKPLRSFYSWAL